MYYKVTGKILMMAGPSDRRSCIHVEEKVYNWHVPERLRSNSSGHLTEMAKSVAVQQWTGMMKILVAKDKRLRDMIDQIEVANGNKWNLYHGGECRTRSWILRTENIQVARLTGENYPKNDPACVGTNVGVGTDKPRCQEATLSAVNLILPQKGSGKNAAAAVLVTELQAKGIIKGEPIIEKPSNKYDFKVDVKF